MEEEGERLREEVERKSERQCEIKREREKEDGGRGWGGERYDIHDEDKDN